MTRMSIGLQRGNHEVARAYVTACCDASPGIDAGLPKQEQRSYWEELFNLDAQVVAVQPAVMGGEAE